MTRIGVWPPKALDTHRRFFDELSKSYFLSIVALDRSRAERLDAGILFDPSAEVLTRSCERSRRLLIFDTSGPASASSSASIRFGDSLEVDKMLRGATLSDDCGGDLQRLEAIPGDVVLASIDGQPIWVRRSIAGAVADVVSIAPTPLEWPDSLWNVARVGRFVAHLPTILLVKEVSTESTWDEPGMRACFIIDDPNLRAEHYGLLDYGELVAAAAEANFHVSIATVPVDTRWMRQSVRSLLAQNSQHISVSAHGNVHFRDEWTRLGEADGYLDELTHSLQRMDRLGTKGSGYDAVQVPPHSRCSLGAADAMQRVGYEALTVSDNMRRRARVRESTYMGGVRPVDLTPSGMPVLLRWPVDFGPAECLLAGTLGRPMIAYGHHDVGRDRASQLRSLATAINDAADVRWMSLQELSRSSYRSSVRGDETWIRPFSRRVDVDLPPGCRFIRVSVESDNPMLMNSLAYVRDNLLSWEPDGPFLTSNAVRTVPGVRQVVQFVHRDARDHRTSSRPVLINPWIPLRRALVTTRDRSHRFLRKPTAHGPE